MANGLAHAVTGGLSGLSVDLLDPDRSDNPAASPLVATAVGGFFGKLPDILEPALNNPHHRQFCHSLLVLIAVGYGVKKAWEWEPKDSFEEVFRVIALCAGAGYISHLVLDGFTPRSLPLLGKM